MGEVRRGALMDPTGTYRYQLWRDWGYGPKVHFVMLNPSTADAMVDDPTIRRCMGFAREWDYCGIVVVNLFALRATKPAELGRHADPVGPDNDTELGLTLTQSNLVICAWGAHPDARLRAAAFRRMAAHRDVPLFCLGHTKDRSPRHPLYLPAGTVPEAL